MAVKLLRLCLLLVLLCYSQAEQQTCLTSASNCDKCIQSGPQCAWCNNPYSDIHCNTLRELLSAGCHKHHVFNPQGGVLVVKNDSSTEPENAKAMFLQPQEVSLHLRPGVSQSFPITITIPTDQQPITELNMDTSPVPAGVNITFSSITGGNRLVVQVNAEAAWCLSESDDLNQMQNRTGPWSVYITPRGFSLSVKLEIAPACKCDCMNDREENSPSCSGHGALVCAQCECYKPYVGQQCQRKAGSFFSPNEDLCRSGPDAPVCSGRGRCVEGFCECEKRVNPKEMYSGAFCQCSNFDCLYHNNSICGGNGRCECGECVCDKDWTGEDCSCTMETASCMANNQQLCNGRGTCWCGACVCHSEYSGPTCEDCIRCSSSCVNHVECVECLSFGTGPKKDRCDQECGYLNVTLVESPDDLPQHEEVDVFCRMRTYEGYCIFYYTLSRTPSGRDSIVVRPKGCSRK